MLNKKSKTGFTIAELLIALAITAMLLAAVATAFNASIKNYTQNEQIFKAVNNARQALVRMTNQMRTGDNFNPADPNNKCSFFTAQGEDITYEYQDPNLYLITKVGGTITGKFVLCDNVTAMNFMTTPTDDGADIKSVQISMTVGIGDNFRKVSSGVVIRKNL
jgi:prepilin-type N-terminal cleavage/methylation domain-containing protein